MTINTTPLSARNGIEITSALAETVPHLVIEKERDND